MTSTTDQPETEPASTSAATPSRPPLHTAELQRRALAARVATLYAHREPAPAQPGAVRTPRPIRYSGLRGL